MDEEIFGLLVETDAHVVVFGGHGVLDSVFGETLEAVETEAFLVAADLLFGLGVFVADLGTHELF